MGKIKELNELRSTVLNIAIDNNYEKIASDYLITVIDLDLCTLYSEKYEGDSSKCLLNELIDKRFKYLTIIDEEEEQSTDEKIIDTRLENLQEIVSNRIDDCGKVMDGSMSSLEFVRNYGKLYKELVENAIYFDLNK